MPQGRVFSDIVAFCNKEVGLARNVKDRLNSKCTVKNLIKIQTEIKQLKDDDLKLGLFIFVGIDEYEKNIFQLMKPMTRCNKFIYKCMNKFMVDGLDEYFTIQKGAIIFANGKSYYIYVNTNMGLQLCSHNRVDLGNRHNKGGFSQRRHERNFDIITDFYINSIVEAISNLKLDNKWIFGSLETINKIIEKDPTLYNGGYLDFDNKTINDTRKWIGYLKSDYNLVRYEDEKLGMIITLLATNSDRLDFDVQNKDFMEFYMINDVDDTAFIHNPACVVLKRNHKHYEQLFNFPYIGVKYKGNEYVGDDN